MWVFNARSQPSANQGEALLRKTRCKHTRKEHHKDTQIQGSNHGQGGGKAEGKWIPTKSGIKRTKPRHVPRAAWASCDHHRQDMQGVRALFVSTSVRKGCLVIGRLGVRGPAQFPILRASCSQDNAKGNAASAGPHSCNPQHSASKKESTAGRCHGGNQTLTMAEYPYTTTTPTMGAPNVGANG